MLTCFFHVPLLWVFLFFPHKALQHSVPLNVIQSCAAWLDFLKISSWKNRTFCSGLLELRVIIICALTRWSWYWYPYIVLPDFMSIFGDGCSKFYNRRRGFSYGETKFFSLLVPFALPEIEPMIEVAMGEKCPHLLTTYQCFLRCR